ncbi:MAG: hypothetical protein WAO35_07490 [Terriglobia bacterium]
MVVDALIAETGDVEKIEVRRDIACLTQVVLRSVERWRFLPATFAGEAFASRVPAAVTFPPPGPFVNPVPLSPLKPQSEAAIQAAFQPAEVTRATFLGYEAPMPVGHVTVPTCTGNLNCGGATVLEVTLSERGEAKEIKALADCPLMTRDAREVVGDWRSMPAAFNGHPVPSKSVLAFVAPPPPRMGSSF